MRVFIARNFPLDPLPYAVIGITVGVYLAFEASLPISSLILISGAIAICFIYRFRNLSLYFVFLILLGTVLSYGYVHLYKSLFYSEISLEKSVYQLDLSGAVKAIKDRSKKKYALIALDENELGLSQVRLPLKKDIVLYPDDKISFNANLYPPPKALFRGDYDFSFYARSHNIDAIGTLKTVNHLERPNHSFKRYLYKFRQNIRAKFQNSLTPKNAAIATAMTTGNRLDLDEQTHKIWKEAGIFHLLSISGLHMTVIAGLAFFVCQRLLFICPPLVRTYDTKKISAFVSILISAFYVLLSGGSIPALRAFIMVTVVLCAIFMDRKLITVRNAIIAYIILLMLNPAELFHVGFGLSFAAVIGIIFATEIIREFREKYFQKEWSLPRRFKMIAFLLINLCASYAGIPISLYAFGYIPGFGFMTNLFAVPFTSLILMPILTVSLFLMPFGFEGYITPLIDASLNMMTFLAAYIAAFEHNIIQKIAPLSFHIMLFYFGLYLATIFHHRARLIGAIPCLAAIMLYSASDQSDILFLQDKRYMAFLDEDRALTILSRHKNYRLSPYLHERLSKYFTISPQRDYYQHHCNTYYKQTYVSLTKKTIQCDVKGFEMADQGGGDLRKIAKNGH
ncbi:MAG: ComEC/Rec2 family competence protein [Pseudomonadota bacterium]